MNTFWIPAMPKQTVVEPAHTPFGSLSLPSRTELREGRSQPAAERRLHLPHFVETFRWENLRPHLPLQLPPPARRPAGMGGCAARVTAGWELTI